MTTTRVNLIRRGGFALGAVVATVAVAACGSSSTTSTSSGTAVASASSGSSSGSSSGRGSFRDPAQRAKLAACLKQHGVTLPARPSGAGAPPASGSSSGSSTIPGNGGYGGPRPGFFGGGPGANPKFRTALKACGVTLGGAGRFTPTARKAAVNRFVTCVARHGYKLPTPKFSGNGPVFPRSIQSNPRFQSASKACASVLRPSGGAQGGGSPPPANA